MSLLSIRRAAMVVLAVSAFHTSSHLIAFDDPAPSSKTPPSAAERRVFAALKELKEASAAWRKELGPNMKLSDQTYKDLRETTLGAMKELGPIIDQTERSNRQAVPDVRRRATSRERAQPLIEAMRSIGSDSEKKRLTALDQIRSSLKGSDRDQRVAALITVASIGDVKYDKASLRPLILPIIEKADGDELIGALYALYNSDRHPEDLALVQAAWKKRSLEVDEKLSHLLFLFGDKKIDGKSAEIILELLDSPNERTQKETLRGLWGARVNDAVAAKLIEMSSDPKLRYDTIYFGLSTLEDKSDAVLDTLIKALSDQEWRALWGLGFGIPEKSQRRVADALVELHNSRTDPKVRRECARLVRQYGGEELASKLNQ
jgi:hypothetical protein